MLTITQIRNAKQICLAQKFSQHENCSVNKTIRNAIRFLFGQKKKNIYIYMLKRIRF